MFFKFRTAIPEDYNGRIELVPNPPVDLGIQFLRETSGRAKPLPPQYRLQLPHTLRFQNQSGNLPECLEQLETIIISERIWQLLNFLEPDTHEFFPISVIATSGAKFVYQIVNIASMSGALDEARSALEMHGTYGHPEIPQRKIHTRSGGSGIVFRDSAVRGHHLFRSHDSPIFGRKFVSEDLKTQLERANIVGLAFDPCRPSTPV